MTKREDCKHYYMSLTENQDCKHYLRMSLTEFTREYTVNITKWSLYLERDREHYLVLAGNVSSLSGGMKTVKKRFQSSVAISGNVSSLSHGIKTT